MRNVLLIAFYFNQTNEVASKRLRGLAKYLPEFGWNPIIIVPKLNNTPHNIDNSNFKVIETEYEDMLDKWLKKLNISLNVNEEKNSNISNPPISKNNQFLSSLISTAGEVFAYPDGMKYWHDPAIEIAKETIEINNIEAIISSSWPITSHVIAKDLKKLYDIPWVADLRDLWNLNPYINHTFIRNYFEKKLEIETFKYADVLTTTTDLAAMTLKKLHPNKKIYSILSGFDPEELKSNHTKNNLKNKSNSSDKLNFVYTGLLYGGKRDPTFLFESIKQLIIERKINPNLISLDFYGDNDGLEKIAKNYHVNTILNLHGSIPNEEVLKKQRESQVLLLLSWNNKKENMFLPGKIYEYLAAQRPILSIGYKEGSLKNLIEDTGVGFHVSTLNQTKETILKIYNNFIENGYVKYKANNNLNDYTLLSTAGKFGKLLNLLTKKRIYE
ncbi:MAG: glycosyl transferase GT4 family protein [Methanobrevibacter sp.]|nr:glycosyl transferase GT4 family protein [Methanobrevibacter sp.]